MGTGTTPNKFKEVLGLKHRGTHLAMSKRGIVRSNFGELMKKWILALAVLVSFQSLAHADQVEDLGAEAEAEELDVFDQKKMEDQQRKETSEMDEKANELLGG